MGRTILLILEWSLTQRSAQLWPHPENWEWSFQICGIILSRFNCLLRRLIWLDLRGQTIGRGITHLSGQGWKSPWCNAEGAGRESTSDQMFSKYQVPIKSSTHFILMHSVIFAVISTPNGKSEDFLLRNPELPVDLVFQVFWSGGSEGKESACSEGDPGLIFGSRFSGEGKGNPL